MLGQISTTNYKNVALYPLQADIRDRSQLFTIHFLNDTFHNIINHDVGHVITGDVNNVANKRLRKLFKNVLVSLN